jgi:hypothetical protein
MISRLLPENNGNAGKTPGKKKNTSRNPAAAKKTKGAAFWQPRLLTVRQINGGDDDEDHHAGRDGDHDAAAR